MSDATSDALLFKRWLFKAFAPAAILKHHANEPPHGAVAEGEVVTADVPRKGAQIQDTSKINLITDYVTLRIPAAQFAPLEVMSGKGSMLSHLRQQIEKRYENRAHFADYTLLSVYDDMKQIVEAKPKEYLLMVDRKLYEEMIVDALKGALSQTDGMHITGLKPDEYAAQVKSRTSDFAKQIQAILESSGLPAPDVAQLRSYAASPASECYEIARLLDNHTLHTVGHVAAVEQRGHVATISPAMDHKPQHGGYPGRVGGGAEPGESSATR